MKNKNEFTFAAQHETHSRSVCKWIMTSVATKHMILHRAAINIRHNMWKLIGNVSSLLYKVEKLKNSIELQVFDYLQSGSVKGGALD